MSVTQYYSEYQRLVGEPRTLQEYRTLLTIFLKHRHNQHVSEIRALEAVIQEAQISWSEFIPNLCQCGKSCQKYQTITWQFL